MDTLEIGFYKQLKKEYELEIREINLEIQILQVIQEQFLFTNLNPLINETITLCQQCLERKKVEYVAKFPAID